MNDLLPLIFPAVGMLADRRRHGAMHPGWFWGTGLILASLAVTDLIAYSPIGYSMTEWVLEGTPGAQRPMEAFVPPL